MKFADNYNLEIFEENIISDDSGIFKASLIDEKNAWYVGIDKKFFEQNSYISPEDICIEFSFFEETKTECLDTEDVDETGNFYSFPVISEPTKILTFSVVQRDGKKIFPKISETTLYALNTLPQGKKLVFSFSDVQANNIIISRASWGADETLRYTNHPLQKAKYEKKLTNAKYPKTEAELKNLQFSRDSLNFIKNSLGSDFETMSLTRYENGKTLVWPIEKVKKVNRIIVHHTAETLDEKKTDEELIRAIYMYHAVTRGWGDIGYNYIVGQTGKIYE